MKHTISAQMKNMIITVIYITTAQCFLFTEVTIVAVENCHVAWVG